MIIHGVGRRRVFAVGLASALMFAGPAPARAAASRPPTGSVSVSVVTEAGSGCGSGAEVFLAPDASGFVLDRVTRLQAGAPGQPATIRAACRTTLSIVIPAGFSFAVQQVEYRGLADLASGATAALRAGFSFPDAPVAARAPLTHALTGPVRDSWEAVDAVAPGELGYVPCGQPVSLRVDTRLRVNAGTANPDRASTLSLGDAAPWPASIYRLTWRTCS